MPRWLSSHTGGTARPVSRQRRIARSCRPCTVTPAALSASSRSRFTPSGPDLVESEVAVGGLVEDDHLVVYLAEVDPLRDNIRHFDRSMLPSPHGWSPVADMAADTTTTEDLQRTVVRSTLPSVEWTGRSAGIFPWLTLGFKCVGARARVAVAGSVAPRRAGTGRQHYPDASPRLLRRLPVGDGAVVVEEAVSYTHLTLPTKRIV